MLFNKDNSIVYPGFENHKILDTQSEELSEFYRYKKLNLFKICFRNKLRKWSQHPCTHDMRQTGGLKLSLRGPGVRFIVTSEPNHSSQQNPGIGFGCSP